MSMIDRIQKATDINDKKYDLTDKERLHNILVEFSFFTKKVLPQMKGMKKALAQYKGTRVSTIANQKILQTLITKYEDLNLKSYQDGDEDTYVFNNPHSPNQIKDQMEHMVDNQKNPFEDLYYWCKGEIYDLQALQEAVNCKDQVEKQQKKYESKRKDVQQDLDNVTAGKKSVRTMFKN